METTKKRKILSLTLAAALFFSLVLPGAANPQASAAATGTTYYVSFIGGDDANDGTSEASAWKTLDKVNGKTFLPGDTILFDNQSVWTGQLAPLGSGTAAAPIVIGKYGAGDRKPLIQCQDMSWNAGFNYNEFGRPINRQYNAAVQFYNQQYWEITNLEVTNFSATLRSFTTYNASGATTTRNNQITPKYGIIIIGHDVGVLRHMYVRDCFVHGVNGEYSSAAGIGRGGINYIIRGTAVPTSWDDIIVENNRVGDIGDWDAGLKVSREQPSIGHYGVSFHGSYVGGSGLFPQESGINERLAGGAYSTNIIVRNNYFQDVGNAAAYFGAVDNGILERNISDHCNSGLNGNVPFWWHDTKHIIAQYNEVFDSGASTTKEDSQAFDPDIGARFNLLQYNYTHDNPSGAYFECDAGSLFETHIRYNLSVNDGNGNNNHGNGAVVTYQSSANANSRMYIYNNDFLIGAGKTSLIGNHWGGQNAHKPHWLVNNFIYDNGAGNGTSSNSQKSGAAGIAYESRFFNSTNFDANYYGGTRAATINPGVAKDANAVTGGDVKIGNLSANMNRALGSNTGWRIIDDYKRAGGGVLENAGTNLPYNGGLDLYGNYVSPFGKPSIGSHETKAGSTVPNGYRVLDFDGADQNLFNQVVDGVKFTTSGWQIKGNELAMNKTGSDVRSCKILIPAGNTVFGFTARAKWAGKVVATFDGKTKEFYLSDTKNSFVTGWSSPVNADTTLTLDFQSPYGVENIRLDNLILSGQATAPETPKKPNVALGKLAAQSDGGPDATLANDGRGPVTGTSGSSLPWWWRVDLGVVHEIDEIQLEWPGGDNANLAKDWKYKIEYSRNGLDWGILTDYTAENPFADPATAHIQNIDAGGIRARYFRVTVTGAPTGVGGNSVTLGEFRAFGKSAGAVLGENIAKGKTVWQNRGGNATNGNDDNPSTSTASDNAYTAANPWIWAVQLDAAQGKNIGRVEVVWPDLQGGANSGAYNGRALPKDWKYKIQYTSSGSLNDAYNSPNWIDLVDYSLRSPYTDYDMSTADWDAGNDPTKTQPYDVAVNAKALRILVFGAPSGLAAANAPAALAEFRAYEATSASNTDVARETYKAGKATVTNYGGNAAASNAVMFDGMRTAFDNNTGAGNTGGITNAGSITGARYAWQIDFGSVYDISGVATCWNPEKDNTNQTAPLDWKYQILSSADGSNWTIVVDYRNTSPYSSKSRADSVYQEVSGLNIKARYMKVAVFSPPTAFSGFWYTLWQFRAFGSVSDEILPVPDVAQDKYAYQNMSLNGRPEAPDDPIFAGKQLNVATAGLTGRASYATDNKADTYAGNTNLDTAHPEYWLAVDLDAKYSASGFEVVWDGTGRDWKYVIESSADGKTWTPVPGADFRASAHPQSASAIQKTTLAGSAIGQFYRVRVTGKHTAGDIPVRLAEFRVFGLKHSAPKTNIALNKTATGTIANPGQAVDGKRSTFAGATEAGKPWGLHGEGKTTADLTVDLGAIYDVDGMRLEFEDMQLVPNYNFSTHADFVASAGVNTTGYASRANTAKNHAEAMKYIVAYSVNGYSWDTLWDYSSGNPCVPVEIRKEITDGGLADKYDNNASVRQGWNYAPWAYETNKAAKVEARYIRVTLTGVPAERRMAQYVIAELEVFGAFNRYSPHDGQGVDAENIAYGKPVLPIGGNTASMRQPEVVTDGKINTSWTANGDALRIDLGLLYDIGSVTVTFAGNTPAAGQVTVKVSEDGIEGANNPRWETFGAESVAAGAVRIAGAATTQGRYLLVSVPKGAVVLKVEAAGEECAAAPRRIMIMGAHPDDEALIGAGAIRRAIENGDDVYILMGTCGDYNGRGDSGSGGQARMRETIAAMTLLGVPWNHIFFLNFPDIGGLDEFGMTGTGNYFLGSSLYQLFMNEQTPDAVIQGRRAGETQTYNGSVPGAVSYFDRFLGGQVSYTRRNFLRGLQDALARIQPDDIYTTSRYDLHGDHAAMGLFATEALVNIKKENPAYNPTLHETFVHSCASDQKNNGNGWPVMTDTLEPFACPQGLEERTILDWNRRESVTVPELMRVLPYSGNMKDQALRKYTSQYSTWLGSFAKYDEFFWARDFENLAFYAGVTASSQKSAVRGAAKAVDGIRDGESTSLKDNTPNSTSTYIRSDHPNRYPTAEWVSNGDGDKAWLALAWNENLAAIDAVTLYDRPTNGVRITGGKLVFDDGTVIPVPALPSDGRPLTIAISPAKETMSLRFEVTAHTGSADVGLAEIEVTGTLKPKVILPPDPPEPPEPPFVPVFDITGAPSEMTTDASLTLTGTVTPGDANNQTIVWSVKDAGTTGAAIGGGNILSASAAGTVTVTATVTGGLGVGKDYTRDFTIVVKAPVIKPSGTIKLTVPDALSLKKGNQVVVGVTTDADPSRITVEGYNSSIIQVTLSGSNLLITVKGLKAGATTLTIKAPGVSKTIAVTVTP